MLTIKQYELLRFIHERLESTSISPSFEEMKEALDLKSKSGIHRLLNSLEERGFLRRLRRRARALEILRMPGSETIPVIDSANQSANPKEKRKVIRRYWGRDTHRKTASGIIDIALHGRIAAGMPIEAFEDNNMLAIPATLIRPGEHYALEVAGDSMVEASILDGDYILIRKTNVAREGDIVVALVDNQDATLKYFHKEGNNIRLDPANPAYESQTYSTKQIAIQGCLSGLLRRYD